MPSTYKTPGVYIEEISTLPASIAQVETAIPAFVGFTEKAIENGLPVKNVPTRIKSLLEYEQYFGKGQKLNIRVDLESDNAVKSVSFNTAFCLYDSMRMFFTNGGGPCYIVSVGDYTTTGETSIKTALSTGLAALRKKDEPTLLLFPDAANLLGRDKLGALQQEALAQCNDLQDRFCIFDLKHGAKELNAKTEGETPELAFRNRVGAQYLKYGAAYYPNIRTSLTFSFSYADVKDSIYKADVAVNLSGLSADASPVDHLEKVLADDAKFSTIYNTPSYTGPGTAWLTAIKKDGIQNKSTADGYKGIEEFYTGEGKAKERIEARGVYIAAMLDRLVQLTVTDTKDESNETPSTKDLFTIHKADIQPQTPAEADTYSQVEELLRKLMSYGLGYTDGTTPEELDFSEFFTKTDDTLIGAYTYKTDNVVADATVYGSPDSATEAADNSRAAYQALFEEALSLYESFEAKINNRKENLELLLRETNVVYSNIANAISKEGISIPPSGAIAGAYAATDNERGVWVAPANRSLSGVIGPVVNITNHDQEGLNVDATAGKSINAIRSFTGRGTLIWGARTLAGNSNEWRYIPVRRLFNMIEESVKKATEFVVFEPNDRNTWLRTKAMIENFLNQIWRAGGLAGAKPEHAYIVKIGLGETMTAQDVLEGRMIVEVHLAAVRPAEFIVLRFMHKLQES